MIDVGCFVCSDGVKETDQIRVGWQILMPWSQWLESKKEEISGGRLGAVGLAFVKADNDVAAFQDFFGVFQKSDKGFLGAGVVHLGDIDQDVETAFKDKGVPSVGLVVVGSGSSTGQAIPHTKTEAQ